MYCVGIIHKKKKLKKDQVSGGWGKMQELLFKCNKNNNNFAIMLRPFTAGQVFITKISSPEKVDL